MAYSSCRAFIIVIAATMRFASAATYSVELAFTETTGDSGSYLSAPFDFGIPFAAVRSLRVEIEMREGYQSVGVTTGNSTTLSILDAYVHAESDFPPPHDFEHFLAASVGFVPPGGEGAFTFERSLLNPNGEVVPVALPAFLDSGHGVVSLIDIYTNTTHLIGGPPSSTEIIWIPPSGITAARLIAEATPTPEPSTAVLLALGPFLLRRRVR